MFHKPKVSVIIPCYNSATFLEKAVESVLLQSLNEIEIILVDDGSTDKTHTLLQQYKMSDNRVELITHSKNKGLGAARNSAVQKALGEYLFFLDSDDYIHQNTLEVLFDKAKNEDLDILQTQHTIHKNGEQKIYPINLIPFPIPVTGVAYFNSGIMIEPKACAKLWKTSFVQINKLQFDTGYYEDVAMVFYAFSIAERINNLLFSGYHYVQRSDSITNQKMTLKHIEDYKVALINIQQLFMNQEFTEKLSSFPASFAMFLVDLSKMALETNDLKIQKETKVFVENMMNKYKSFIKSNTRLAWGKKQAIAYSPYQYTKLKKKIGL